ncbi:MAG TPA: CBS domain-containing protein [Anaerolineae bacterium]|nr:CBS domain-containing protein [Anaerolineae bacterium]
MTAQSVTLVLTHEHADFDAIASLLAAALITPEAIPLLPHTVNRNVRGFLALYGPDLPFVELDDLPRAPIERVILVDTQALPSVRGVTPDTQVTLIDHHPRSEALPAHWTFQGEPVGATITLIVETIAARRIELTPAQATLLLLGIYEDTGSLLYADTTARDAHAAGYLLEHGVNLSQAREFLQHTLSDAQRALYDQLVQAATSHEINGHVVALAAASSGEHLDEISTLAHRLRDLLEPDALFILVTFDGHIQIVARSAVDAIDVGAICQALGGGGHARAAAALVRDGNLAGVQTRLLDEIRRQVRPAVTVAQIMSRGGQTLETATTVAEAARRMQRTGFEGYPVIKDGQVVGLLTRRAVDRALNHKMGGRPIASIMEQGRVTVSPDDPVEKLERLMIAHGWGQVPVVNGEGRVIGIVTRTDVLKLWSAKTTSTRRREIGERLEQSLAPELLALIQQIAASARRMGSSLFFVGGIVRDLLLGQPLYDVDFVVEGNAIALAQALAREHGGRVKSHARFGTAKWLLDPRALRIPTPDGLGLRTLDFVTARTEFYTHPTALPQVEQSSIKQDLHRRDFTINALAVCLDPERFGELLDFYGGERDLRDGVMRVLHSLSFVEDPTRMLRAARFEQRFGFHIEPRTQDLLINALDLLERVSGPRIRNELELIFQEKRPEKSVCRLDELGVLAHVHAALHCDEWLIGAYTRARESLGTPAPFIYLALLAYRLDAQAVRTLIRRLRLPRDVESDLYAVIALRDAHDQIRAAVKASQVYRLLQPYSARALQVARVATADPQVRAHLDWFVRELREVKPSLGGTFLRSLGLPPGPVYGRILHALRDALLDGEIRPGADEEAFVRTMVEKGVHLETALNT